MFPGHCAGCTRAREQLTCESDLNVMLRLCYSTDAKLSIQAALKAIIPASVVSGRLGRGIEAQG